MILLRQDGAETPVKTLTDLTTVVLMKDEKSLFKKKKSQSLEETEHRLLSSCTPAPPCVCEVLMQPESALVSF